MYKVFVYGSLKRGFHNFPFLKSSNKVGVATTQEPLVMTTLGSFPGVRRPIGDEVGAPVVGEIYSVDEDTLRNLDRLEGNGHFYQREVMATDIGPAWVYLLMEPSGNNYPQTDGKYIWHHPEF